MLNILQYTNFNVKISRYFTSLVVTCVRWGRHGGPCTALKAYFDNRVEPMLRANLIAGCAGWTNNACESINHVLKQRMQWRRSMLPDLCNSLQSLVDSQYLEADRALCGRGDLQLQSAYQHHRVTVDVWRSMTEQQRQRVRDATFALQVPATAGAKPVTSTDGELRVLHRPNAGKKLNQRKRPRADRTITPSKRTRTA